MEYVEKYNYIFERKPKNNEEDILCSSITNITILLGNLGPNPRNQEDTGSISSPHCKINKQEKILGFLETSVRGMILNWHEVTQTLRQRNTQALEHIKMKPLEEYWENRTRKFIKDFRDEFEVEEELEVPDHIRICW